MMEDGIFEGKKRYVKQIIFDATEKDNTSLYDITKKLFGENAVGGLGREEWEKRYVESYDKPINKNKTEIK